MFDEKLVLKSKDIMREIEKQVGQTVGLGCLDPETRQGTVVAQVIGTRGVAYHIEVGYHFPLHTSVPSKAVLAYLPPYELEHFMSCMDLKRFTPSTITNRADFEAELASIREKGYAIDVAEQMEGCHCVGVPVFGDSRCVVAGLYATGPSLHLPVRIFEQVAAILKNGSQEITRRLSSGRRSSDRRNIISVVDQACEILQNNLHQSIDIRELATNLYVSYSWFRKVFKEQTGEAPLEYHLNRRIRKSVDLLRNTDLSVRMISEEMGFENQNHFSALFKRKTGHAPSEVRNKL